MALKGFEGLPQLNRIAPAADNRIKKIVNIEDPEEDNDAVNKGFLNKGFLESILIFNGDVTSFNGNVLIHD